ncbi:MAG: helix-turn-helix transcriptional regulator [Rhodocyclaceae bacterium]|jgi:hypothetical protein|nr:helix-turn-helix transcriptional regulator [Rhodocyclaceae bacterium]MCA3024397.1 helix-turn-helix transcriptional regulator [Rhodocyclaceae bacterium]MCA3032548.1 helix-turn-helix transcriptional regulator [Rhodocyclaceae bacterium]MCA3037477.1 helix-turn-helix transcriptional regulator [Rhodocyclaceae bacterium]MCA3047289.1 helix-turn-helix transcriptional regulator [Rhodocyclaceae bacterium]
MPKTSHRNTNPNSDRQRDPVKNSAAAPTQPSAKSRTRQSITPVRKIVLRVRAVMGDRGYRSVTALQRSLAAIGVAISVPQLLRVVDGDAKHLNKEVIEGLLTVFDCSVSELFAVM